jgi:hypothetical protein
LGQDCDQAATCSYLPVAARLRDGHRTSALFTPIWLRRLFTLVFARGSVSTTALGAEVAASFLPFVLCGASMLLCLRARQRAQRKRLVLVYAVVLAPFAFSYPAWILFLFVLYVSGRYTGPMP